MVVELPYSLHTRKKSIAIAWSVILVPPVFLNIGLFYGLWYGRPDLDRLYALTLPIQILGIFTVVATLDRIQKLIRREPDLRPLGSGRYASGRWSLDVFQWGYFFVLIAISILVSAAIARQDQDKDNHAIQIRLLSLPASVLMFLVATLTLLSLILNWSGWEVPFRFGSIQFGGVIRPAVFYIVEDVVAVDGFGGKEYRKAFNARYDSSSMFRKMIKDVSIVWMLWFYVWAVLFTILVMKLPIVAVYAVGWAGPFPLAGLLAIWTTKYVQRMLRIEEEEVQADERTPLLNGST